MSTSKDLFGFVVPEPAKKKGNSKAIDLHAQLVSLYGASENKCKNCKHFVVKQYAGTYFKCAKAGNINSSSAATDWRANWPACGLFNPEI